MMTTHKTKNTSEKYAATQYMINMIQNKHNPNIAFHDRQNRSMNQSISQSYFLTWPKQQTATSRTTEGKHS